MILSGKEIERRLGKDIVIEPFKRSQLNPNSYNLRLHDELVVYSNVELDMKRNNPVDSLTIPAEGFILVPGKLYLARTLEYTETHNLVPMLEGRSSIGRLGLCVHITAGFGDIGFCGFWTLEMYCIQPVRVYAGVEVCQVFYHSVEGDYETYAGGKYQNNKGVQASMIYREFEKE